MSDNNSHSDSYASAGVDITAGYKAVQLMKSHIARTSRPGTLEGVGGFGGLFEADMTGMAKPVMVSGTDGVGTKLKVAFLADKHDTVGIDCVAMCANDIACCGAEPLFFLDYIALGKNIPEKVAAIVSGVAEGCVQAGCALIGGETAEMPGMYIGGEYDLAGFCVGMADKDSLWSAERVTDGDVIIALASSGVHSNGYSLVRKVFDVNENNINDYYPEFGKTLAEELLTPTKIYVKALKALSLAGVEIHAAAHITGGGFYENIPRSIPKGLCATIDASSVKIPAVFEVIAKKGNIAKRDMFNTFNMGVGMSLFVKRSDADKALRELKAIGESAYIMGEITKSDSERIVLK